MTSDAPSTFIVNSVHGVSSWASRTWTPSTRTISRSPRKPTPKFSLLVRYQNVIVREPSGIVTTASEVWLLPMAPDRRDQAPAWNCALVRVHGRSPPSVMVTAKVVSSKSSVMVVSSAMGSCPTVQDSPGLLLIETSQWNQPKFSCTPSVIIWMSPGGSHVGGFSTSSLSPSARSTYSSTSSGAPGSLMGGLGYRWAFTVPTWTRPPGGPGSCSSEATVSFTDSSYRPTPVGGSDTESGPSVFS